MNILFITLQRAEDPEELPDKQTTENNIIAIPPRRFSHEVDHSSRAAAIGSATVQAPGELKTTLTDEQLKMCGDEYINNGIVRSVIDRTVFMVQGDRTGSVIEANDELTDSVPDEEQKELQEQIANDELTIEEQKDPVTNEIIIQQQDARIKDLRKKMIRLNKRVKLHMQIEKLLTSIFVFGRGALEIIRLAPQDNGEYPRYGEPIALKHLVSRNIIEIKMNKQTWQFEGIWYRTDDVNNPVRFIKAPNLIIGFNDDHNILDKTRGSGLSLVWPVLSVAQADDVINDEDIPSATRNLGAKFGFIYAGTDDDSKKKEIEKKIANNSWLIHGLPDLRAQIEDLGRDLMELPNVRNADAKYICMCMSLPLFLLFEDTANFATANQTMQTYKAGVLKRYRVWVQGMLEDFWYDTILADHLNIDVKDVISAPIKIKAIFNDINFETRSEMVNADHILLQDEVLNKQDVAKDIDRKDIVQRLNEEEAAEEKERQKAIAEAMNRFKQMQNQNGQQPGLGEDQQPINGNGNGFEKESNQPPQLQAFQKQRQVPGNRFGASSTAEVEAEEDPKEKQIHNERMGLYAKMSKVLDNLS